MSIKRIKALLESLSPEGLDGLLITAVPNVTYLSNFTGEAAHLIVSAKGCYFFTDPRYTEQASTECHPEIEVFNWIENKRIGIESYQLACKQLGIKRLGFESNHMNHGTFKKLQEGLAETEFVPTENLVENLRRIKDEDEIHRLRTAAEISDRALELTLPFIRAGISEMALTAQLEYFMKTNGAEGLSFDTMVLSGKKTSLLHGQPGSKVLEKGDFVLFDFGAIYKGYHADISRTFVIGSADSKQRSLYEQIQKAEMDSIMTIRPGVLATVPDAKVREILSEAFLPFYYQGLGHGTGLEGLGHGTGLEVHEGVSLSQTSVDTLQKNMVLTVEPGVYIPDWGGMRIEDSIVVTENGIDLLNKFPRELMCL